MLQSNLCCVPPSRRLADCHPGAAGGRCRGNAGGLFGGAGFPVPRHPEAALPHRGRLPLHGRYSTSFSCSDTVLCCFVRGLALTPLRSGAEGKMQLSESCWWSCFFLFLVESGELPVHEPRKAAAEFAESEVTEGEKATRGSSSYRFIVLLRSSSYILALAREDPGSKRVISAVKAHCSSFRHCNS